ncbi:MAG: hypothetical protein A2499_00425 [Stygiobacter sp. RIFOXYC12_FULL_38_8]|nr:MAG: hypothetical protein A2X62_16850 [Stygiobacter sp. GWC2_38_9]OGU82335.1 MAG: hypothetical protein A2279_09490 [Stygiobacter sp. RIFOXYA12_FULL_38_9]OGV06548.1 MAG: hypothetical protein A2299_02480 [Stygiobacter sp. RIFOXYB2_FULL_37_11]OGV13191.1 MAG: hypothetical protein A2440_12740 [Stygiobacter sp. RIFOXYC2_FULL_38_25]OGV14667.1 MAG: hypothetical protein A2237_03540 [Stygiobacter sp. RIFOXYA2_FULL_38_8]OGV26449.1 MAG: hypothetical protein A2499_00425 [Stygiobacter sp. RIFOXYC12_FULL_
MKKLFTVIVLVLAVQFVNAQTVIFSENFESGTASSTWGTHYKGEETVISKPMSAAPKVLTGGGNYVGLLQDINGSYTGSAVAVNGDVTLKDYSIEADVYCYQNQSLSAYAGLVVYSDSSKKDFYKIRVDFDVSNRINFSGLKSDPATFLPLFSYDFKGTVYAGGYPTTDGWHKIKVEVRTVSATKVSFWCYFDNILLTGSPVSYDKAGAVTAGRFGLYSFQQSATGLATYYDNIVVKSMPPTAIEDENNIPTEFSLEQNFPNPFNPETKISYKLQSPSHVSLKVYDLLGNTVATLVNEYQQAGSYNSNFSINNTQLSSGVYLYTLQAGNFTSTKKMVLIK